MADDSAIAVFTFRGYEQMLAEGGSFAWVLDKARAETCKYVVCVRNRHNPDHPPEGEEPHSSIFMVAEVDGLEPNQAGRWLIRFKDPRRINPKPVRWLWRDKKYGTLKEFGINLGDLAEADDPGTLRSSSVRGRTFDAGSEVSSFKDGHSADPKHAPIVRALRDSLEHSGWKVVKRPIDVCADLFVTKDGNELLFEVKPDSSLSSLYSGIGQLLVYAQATGCKRKILVTPAKPTCLEKAVDAVLMSSKIEFVTFEESNQGYRFPSLLAALG